MSVSSQEEATQMSAIEIDLLAANWLQRRHFWDWADEDQAALDAWLAKSEAHRIAYWRQSAGWNRTERLVVLRSPKSEMPDVEPRKTVGPLSIRVATALIFVAVLGIFGLRQFLGSAEAVYQTGVGEHRTIVLADGSRIELNTGTILRANIGAADKRTVWLEKGEAYFQVKHDATRPFVVMAANQRIVDLGTKFLVRRKADRLEVALSEGQIRLESTTPGAHAQPSLLAPGDVAIATADAVSVTKKSRQKLANELGWRHGVLVFDRTSLGDAAAELNRYNHEQLVISDAAVARRMIGGTFPTNNIELFARVARDLLGLRVEHRGEETVISR
jgi:transmembrane sensor